MAEMSIYNMVYKYLLGISGKRPVVLVIIKSIGTLFWLFVIWSAVVFISYIMFKHLLNKNIISSQLSFWNTVGTYATTFEEKARNTILPSVQEQYTRY
jgi:hypothetical protein